MSDSGIYEGPLDPTSFVFGACELHVRYPALDTVDDVDDLPESRKPTKMFLELKPNIEGVSFYADGVVYVPQRTVLESTTGDFAFNAVDGTHSLVNPQGWNWHASLTVNAAVTIEFDFPVDSSAPTNIGAYIPIADAQAGNIVLGDIATDALSIATNAAASSTASAVSSAGSAMSAAQSLVAAQATQAAAEGAELAKYATQDSGTATLIGLAASATQAALDARYVNPATLTRQGVIIPATISHADVQAAITSAAATGGRVQASGAYTTASTLVITSDCDLSNLVITYTGTGVAVQAGDATVRPWKRLVMPRVIYGNKPATTWDAGTVGVKVVNIQSCVQLIIPHVKGFETGALFYGQGQGVVYNTVFIGHVENNKRNLSLDNDASGWVNQNTFIGGRFSHSPAQGQPAAGTAHVWSGTSPNGANNNTFIGCSLETPGVVEYMVDLGNTSYNRFINCRWEATSGTANVRWGTGSQINRIIGGYNSGSIVETRAAGSSRNVIESTSGSRVFANTTSGIVGENTTSSGSPVWTIVPAGSDVAQASPATAYTASMAATSFKFKSSTDTAERIRIDSATGRIYYGPGGAVNPTVYISGTSSTLQLGGGHLIFDTDGTRDVGFTGYRPRDVLVSRYVRLGTLMLGDFSGVLKVSSDGGGTWKSVNLT